MFYFMFLVYIFIVILIRGNLKMEKILFYKKYNVKETLIKYECKTIKQLEDALAEELRKKYKTGIINIYKNNNTMIIEVKE